jgi:DNA-binding transcriptional ArsR family regulator
MSKAYIRFLRIAKAIEILPRSKVAIDCKALNLLDEIAVRNYEGMSMTVEDAKSIKAIASPATLHRKLDELREAGLIEQVFDGKDRRTKYLILTKLADAYFAKMSKAMTNAVN